MVGTGVGKYGDLIMPMIKGEIYKRATRKILKIFEFAGVREDTLWTRLTGIRGAGIRSKLHGWLLWSEFCERRNITPSDMRTMVNPAVVVAEFVQTMYEDDVSETKKREALPAVY